MIKPTSSKLTMLSSTLTITIILISHINAARYNITASDGNFACSLATANDECHIYCDLATFQTTPFECGNAGECYFYNIANSCMKHVDSQLWATNSNNLYVYGLVSDAWTDGNIYLPDSGNAILETSVPKGLKKAVLHSGTNTQHVTINCNGGNEDCRQMQVDLRDIQYLEINVLASGSVFGDTADLYCPSFSLQSTYDSAPCNIYVAADAKFKADVHAPNGYPQDVWVECYGDCANLKIDCTGGEIPGPVPLDQYPFHNASDCWNTRHPTTNPTTQPTTNPTMQPTEPTKTPSSSPTEFTSKPTSSPSTEPTVEPTMQPTTPPTVVPTAEPTVQPSTEPTTQPTAPPSTEPSVQPTVYPTLQPTTSNPTFSPTTSAPTTSNPSSAPTTKVPTDAPVRSGQIGAVSTTSDSVEMVAAGSGGGFFSENMEIVIIGGSAVLFCVLLVVFVFFCRKYAKNNKDSDEEIVMSENNLFGANDNVLAVSHRLTHMGQDEGAGKEKDIELADSTLTTMGELMGVSYKNHNLLGMSMGSAAVVQPAPSSEVYAGINTGDNGDYEDDDMEVIDEMDEMMQTPGNQSGDHGEEKPTNINVPAPICMDDADGTQLGMVEIPPIAIVDNEETKNDSSNDSGFLSPSDALSPTETPVHVQYKVVVTPVGITDTLTSIVQQHMHAQGGQDDADSGQEEESDSDEDSYDMYTDTENENTDVDSP